MSPDLVVLPQVAVNVRAARQAAGLTQEGLARRLDLSVSTVQGWEAAVRLPHGRNLKALADALNLDPSWFYIVHSPSDSAAA